MLNYIKDVIDNMPKDWLNLTTHRLDIYNEKLAKIQFLDQFEVLYSDNIAETSELSRLPTAYDYIRLGHPLSCVLEWGIAKLNNLSPKNVISFSSKSIPLLAILRKNLLENKNTKILYINSLPECFDAEVFRNVYGYKFDLEKIESIEDFASDSYRSEGSIVLISEQKTIEPFNFSDKIDFYINLYTNLGSVLLINGAQNGNYISDIQHVRRRETIAMTPVNSLIALNVMIEKAAIDTKINTAEPSKTKVLNLINEVAGTTSKPLVGSSGLSIQYAILMGLIHDALETHKGKAIKIIVPTNCYGGTNDQARRVAACLDTVEIVDLEVDGDNDMVQSINTVLDKIADEDAVPYIIAEIPTNPRVEVPDLVKLREALNSVRKTASGDDAIDPVFILDQTFCPNVQFLREGGVLSGVRTISFSSGSKFPSGGKCIAGYCIGNKKVANLMEKIKLHLRVCDNEATETQYEMLAKQMPSMNQRIFNAYRNTRDFVNFVSEALPEAKINFVTDDLAKEGFTPSVFSIDLPTKGNTESERETYKRALNRKLIHLMISEIPHESKFCVSYGQLKGSYWTIPATSTQGTTKEGDKDYIVRASLSPEMDLDLHKKVFLDFVASI